MPDYKCRDCEAKFNIEINPGDDPKVYQFECLVCEVGFVERIRDIGLDVESCLNRVHRFITDEIERGQESVHELSNLVSFLIDDILRPTRLEREPRSDEAIEGQKGKEVWDCPCGYQNAGPICTKCGNKPSVNPEGGKVDK